MSSTVGSIKNVAIRKVWPTEHADFTRWLQAHIGELDNVVGLGLTNPQREVGAGDFSIDLVAETNFGDVVIENQFGRSDHRHLGQLVTYLSQWDVAVRGRSRGAGGGRGFRGRSGCQGGDSLHRETTGSTRTVTTSVSWY